MATMVDLPYPVLIWAILPFISGDLPFIIPKIDSIWVLYGSILKERRIIYLKIANTVFLASAFLGFVLNYFPNLFACIFSSSEDT
jgi:hypothetical protein